MTTVLWDEAAAATPLGEMLRKSLDPCIEIRNKAGKLVARVVLASESEDAEDAQVVATAEQEIDELRRRCKADRTGDLTTTQLLQQLHSTGGQ